MDTDAKFAVVSNVNGVFKIDSEWGSNLDGARVAYFERCKVLWNAKDVARAVVRLVDRDFNTFTNYVEYIGHEQEAE